MKPQLTPRALATSPVFHHGAPEPEVTSYDSQTKAKLLAEAKERDLRVPASVRKAEVIEALEQDDAA